MKVCICHINLMPYMLNMLFVLYTLYLLSSLFISHPDPGNNKARMVTMVTQASAIRINTWGPCSSQC